MKKLLLYILLLSFFALHVTLFAEPPSPDPLSIKWEDALSSGDNLRIDAFVFNYRYFCCKYLQRNLENYFSSGDEKLLKSLQTMAESISKLFDDNFYLNQIKYYSSIDTELRNNRLELINQYDSLNLSADMSPPDSVATAYEAIALQFIEIYDTSAAVTVMQVSWLYHLFANKQNKAGKLLQKSINLSQLCGDLDGLGRSFNLLGNHYLNNGQYLDAGEFFDSSRAIAVLLGNTKGEADEINNIAIVYLETGNKRLALEYSKAALEKLSNLSDNEIGARSYYSAKILQYMISTYRDVTSLKQLNNWLEELEKIYSLYEYASIDIYRARAEVLESEGDFELALIHYKYAKCNLVTTMTIARLNSKLGKYNKALDANNLAIQKAEEYNDYKALGVIHHNLGVIYQRLGDYETAVSHYIQSLDYKQSQNRQHEMVETLLSLSEIYLTANATNKAKEYFLNAQNLSRALKIPRLEAKTCLVGAKLYSKIGESSKASDNLDSAITIYRKSNNLQGEFDTYILQAEIARTNNDIDQAFRSLDLASKVSAQSNNNKNIRQLETIKGLTSYDSKQLDSAYKYLARSISWLESNRQNIDDFSLRSYQSSHNRFIYEKMVLLFLDDNKMKSLDSAIAYMEMAKARTLQEMIQQNRSEYLNVDSSDILYEPDLEVFNKVSADLDNPETAILNYFLTPEKSVLIVLTDNGKQVFELPTRENITNHLIEYLELLQLSIKDEKLIEPLKQKAIELSSLLFTGFADQISAFENIYIIPDGALSTLPFETLIVNYKYVIETSSVTLLPSLSFYLSERKKYDSNGKLLMIAAPNYQAKHANFQNLASDPKTAILNYIITDLKSGLLVISNQGKQHFELADHALINICLEEYLELLQQSDKSEKLKQKLKLKASEISSILFADFKDQISNYNNIYIFPDKNINLLPFETLIIDDKYLSDIASITILPPLPYYSLISEKSKDSDSILTDAQSKQGKYPPLKYALDEALAIIDLFEKDSRNIMIGMDANKENLRAWDVLNYNYLHFATHSYIDHQEPLKSTIILANDSAGNRADLTLEEIMSMKLNADLVVLSSCESGGGRFHLGEGIDGFVRGFLYAGAHNIVVSLWSVDDFTTSIFMEELYHNLKLGYAQALRIAKLKLINSPRLRFRHPYYWSPFVLVQGK